MTPDQMFNRIIGDLIMAGPVQLTVRAIDGESTEYTIAVAGQPRPSNPLGRGWPANTHLAGLKAIFFVLGAMHMESFKDGAIWSSERLEEALTAIGAIIEETDHDTAIQN